MNLVEIGNLNNFKIHARGDYVMISGYTEKKEKYTFLATTPILKYILCEMNKKIKLGSLSKCQMGGIFMALKNIGCDYEIIIVNDQPMIIPNKKEIGFQRVQVKRKSQEG